MSQEEGSVTPVVAAILTVALLLVLAIGDAVRVVEAKMRSQVAADAAALAAVQALVYPTGEDASAVAASYAELNGARLVACGCSDPTKTTVRVSSHVDLAIIGGGSLDIEATATGGAALDTASTGSVGL